MPSYNPSATPLLGTLYSSDHFSHNPPPARPSRLSGHMASNIWTGPQVMERDPVDYVSNRFSNVPPRFELFLLGDDEKKVTITPETRVPNASTFLFRKEDHTLGNLLRSRLLSNPAVLFAAYRVPHPLFADFELRVQTDGSLSPKEALLRACRDVVQDLGALSREFTKEWELKRISRMAEDGPGLI